ncbi:MAG: GNAT family N-acetyltransferase [Promethearchaeota archaeon]
MIHVELAKEDDAQGIHDVLLENLIEIENIDDISSSHRTKLEKQGFLRKEVGIDYYKKLIQDESINIYVAKDDSGIIIGFGSIHENQHDVRQFRSTLDNIYTDNEKTLKLLTESETKFAYLDQVSIVVKYKRSGVGTAIFNEMLLNLDVPIVSFIVEVPLANKASARWHEHLGFDLAATCDGDYKGKKFKWWIYIFWINEK